MSASPASPPLGQQIARWVAGVGMTLAGVSHLTFARKGFQAQVPNWAKTDWLDTDDIVLVSGAVEIALGLGLLVLPKERRRMAALTTAVLVAVFPGNISQYVHQRDGLGLDTDRKRLVRLFTEPLIWAMALHAGGLLPGRTAVR